MDLDLVEYHLNIIEVKFKMLLVVFLCIQNAWADPFSQQKYDWLVYS